MQIINKIGDRMYLKEYLDVLEQEGLVVKKGIRDKDSEVEISNVSYNSSNVTENTLFVCKGAAFKEEYLKMAVNKGAICYVCQEGLKITNNYDCSFILVKDIRKAMALIAKVYYKEPWKSFINIGITGTKGKTTTVYFLKDILEEYLKSKDNVDNKKIGLLSSIITCDGKEETEAILTTPEIFELHDFFQKMKDNGVSYEVMEVSSQALKYDRTLGVEYDIGCFTNISNDHIGTIEHADFEDYFESKLKLLHQCRIAVINSDIPKVQLDKILEETEDCEKVITYGLSGNADVQAKNIDSSIEGVKFDVVSHKISGSISLAMVGEFNVNNALAAITIALELDIPMDCIRRALAKSNVPGRMTIFKNKVKDITAVVDFAHNKLSYIAMFESLKKLLPNANYTIVFGCPGVKGINRRKDLGEIVNDYVAKVVLTEEDCGIEDPIDICKDIDKYIDHSKIDVHIETDRENAIKYAIETAKPGELVIIAGKSADTTIKRGKEYVPIETDLELCAKYIY